MLLVGTGGTRSLVATGADPRSGDPLNLHFSVPTAQGEQHFRMEAQISRVLDSGNGMGIRFPSPLQPKAFEVLMDFAVASGMVANSAADLARGRKPQAEGDAQQQTEGPVEIPETFLRDRRIRDQDAEQVKEQLRRVATRGVNRISKLFFEKCDRDLLLKARDAGTNAGQMMYFEALDQLEKQRDSIRTKFGRAVIAQIDQISDLETVLEKRRRRETGSSLKLQLVDTEEFEEWLAVAEVISKTENRFGDILFEIRSRLGMIAKPWGHKDVVPIGPAALAWAFDDALSDVDVRRQVRQDIYKEFEIVLHSVLSNLYPAITKMLEETGVFPSLEELREALQRSSRRNAAKARPEPSQNYQELEAPVREAAMAADGISVAPGASFNPFAQKEGGTAEVYKAARELLNLGRRARRMQGAAEQVEFASPNAGPDQRYEPQDILQAISQIEAEMGDAPVTDSRLKPRLMEVLKARHGGKKAFGEELYDTLDVMENLVDSIEQDKLLTEGIRGWVKRLEVTLNKLATKDRAFLEHDAQRSAQRGQAIEPAGAPRQRQDVRDGMDREVGRRVDELLERMSTNSTGTRRCSKTWSKNRPAGRASQAGRIASTSSVRCGPARVSRSSVRARRAVAREHRTERIAGKRSAGAAPQTHEPGLAQPPGSHPSAPRHRRARMADAARGLRRLHGLLDGSITPESTDTSSRRRC